jgi:hypothetical protein
VRAALVVIVLVAAAVAGCGSAGDQTLSVGEGQSITVPNDVHGVYGELKAILDQLPYQQWYRQCVVGKVEKGLSPAEAESLAELPQGEREQKAMQVTAKAGFACEAESNRPVIDPNASSEELDLLRAGMVPSMIELAESENFTPTQVACVQSKFKTLPDDLLIKLRNGSKKARSFIVVSILKACAGAE